MMIKNNLIIAPKNLEIKLPKAAEKASPKSNARFSRLKVNPFQGAKIRAEVRPKQNIWRKTKGNFPRFF